MRKHLKVVVAGDVDAGKSTLIGRFLYECGSLVEGALGNIGGSFPQRAGDFEFAYLLDSFEEERREQLTIDTTQAFCRDKKGREWLFIDVPGHRELIKNMLVGSSYADAAVVVLDASCALKEQSKRHIQLLELLGFERFIVAINKMDSFSYAEEVFKDKRAELSAFLGKLEIKPLDCIPISARQGDNFIKSSRKTPWYKGKTLIEALDITSPRKNRDVFRLAIQDLYKVGRQVFAAGLIISGKIKVGEKVIVMPSGEEGRVRQIKVFKTNVRTAAAPENVALVLEGDNLLRRGMILCKTELPDAGRKLSAKIFCLKDFDRRRSLNFKSLSQAIPARIGHIYAIWDSADLKLKPKTAGLQELDLAQIELNTEKSAVTEKFRGVNSLGRFVLEDKNGEICAAGVIS